MSEVVSKRHRETLFDNERVRFFLRRLIERAQVDFKKMLSVTVQTYGEEWHEMWQQTLPRIQFWPSSAINSISEEFQREVSNAAILTEFTFLRFACLGYGKDAYGKKNRLEVDIVPFGILYRSFLIRLARTAEMIRGTWFTKGEETERTCANALSDALHDVAETRVRVLPPLSAPERQKPSAVRRTHSRARMEEEEEEEEEYANDEGFEADGELKPTPATATAATTRDDTDYISTRKPNGASYEARSIASLGLHHVSDDASRAHPQTARTVANGKHPDASLAPSVLSAITADDSASQLNSLGVRHQKTTRREAAASQPRIISFPAAEAIGTGIGGIAPKLKERERERDDSAEDDEDDGGEGSGFDGYESEGGRGRKGPWDRRSNISTVREHQSSMKSIV